MFQSIFLLPELTWGKLIFCISPVGAAEQLCCCLLFNKNQICYIPLLAACWRGLHNIEFQVNNVRACWSRGGVLTNYSLFLFWVNYHVIVVCWIIFSQKRNYSDNKQLMSFVGMKVRYDDKTILYVKTFPGIWTIAVLQISQYFFPFPPINQTFLSSVIVVIWKICRSPKNMSTLSILGLINIQQRWVLYWVISHIFQELSKKFGRKYFILPKIRKLNIPVWTTELRTTIRPTIFEARIFSTCMGSSFIYTSFLRRPSAVANLAYKFGTGGAHTMLGLIVQYT